MAKSKAEKLRHDDKKYRKIIVRVSRGSELDFALAEQLRNGVSVNFLINSLLAAHYGVDLPLRCYTSRETLKLI